MPDSTVDSKIAHSRIATNMTGTLKLSFKRILSLQKHNVFTIQQYSTKRRQMQIIAD
jgi:hypothetical protein